MKCSNCGAVLAEGAKFCGECGAKAGGGMSSSTIDWHDDKISPTELDGALSANAVELLVREIKSKIQPRAVPGRVLIRGDKEFDKKIGRFATEYNSRVGNDSHDANIRNRALALFDYSTNGSGTRGFVFADKAVYNITNATPTADADKGIMGCIPWKIFFRFAESVVGNAFWKVSMFSVLHAREVNAEIKAKIKDKDYAEKLFFTEEATGLEYSFMAYELLRIKNLIRGRDEITVDPQEVLRIFRRLKSQLKTDRIYFEGDEPFEMKCDTLLKSAASVLQGMSVDDNGFSAMDRIEWFKGDEPRKVTVSKDDYLAVLDNSKAGLFGGFDKRPCLFGGLVTKKGIFVYNFLDGKKGCDSGFAPWNAIYSVGATVSSAFGMGMRLFKTKALIPYPRVPYPRALPIDLWFDRASGCKRSWEYFSEAIIHLWYFVYGVNGPFEFEKYIEADPMGDADD